MAGYNNNHIIFGQLMDIATNCTCITGIFLDFCDEGKIY